MSKVLINNFYKQRGEFYQQSAARNEKLTFPEGIEEYTNIPYGSDGLKEHRMDIFRPKGKKGEVLPVIVNVHGGGLLLGNKEFNRYFCAQLSARGYLVFSVEYRLVPDVQIYDQFADLSLAMDSIEKLLPQYQGDTKKVYVSGDSGGACLIVYTIAMQKCRKLAEAAHVTPSTLKVQALGLISGMFYTTKFDKIGLFLPPYLYGKNYKKEAFAPYVNPEHPHIVTSLPPCFLVTSHNDMLKHYTLNFEKALTKHNVSHELKNYPRNPQLTHAFSVFEPFMKESEETISLMLDFFEKN